MVCDMFTNLREFRLKRSLDKRKLARLDSDYDFDAALLSNEASISERNREKHHQRDQFDSFSEESYNFDIDTLDSQNPLPEHNGFSTEEIQKLEAENSKIFHDFEEMVGETRYVMR